MNFRNSQATGAISRCKAYGLFGGAALGSIVGVIVSGPNFFVWSPFQSVGVIAGLAAGMAMIGYLFIGLVVGGFAGGGASDGEEVMSGSVDGGIAGGGADGGGGGD